MPAVASGDSKPQVRVTVAVSCNTTAVCIDSLSTKNVFI